MHSFSGTNQMTARSGYSPGKSPHPWGR